LRHTRSVNGPCAELPHWLGRADAYLLDDGLTHDIAQQLSRWNGPLQLYGSSFHYDSKARTLRLLVVHDEASEEEEADAPPSDSDSDSDAMPKRGYCLPGLSDTSSSEEATSSDEEAGSKAEDSGSSEEGAPAGSDSEGDFAVDRFGSMVVARLTPFAAFPESDLTLRLDHPIHPRDLFYILALGCFGYLDLSWETALSNNLGVCPSYLGAHGVTGVGTDMSDRTANELTPLLVNVEIDDVPRTEARVAFKLPLTLAMAHQLLERAPNVEHLHLVLDDDDDEPKLPVPLTAVRF